ncbi:hypothetical protein B0J12DRAFT_682530 [Macrophomina phaseolina]|uniref:Rhodopsin domain-containing protein n=1 Tax=Macrophomina phaseolina TaxID=35725 RepID=A0ABQ8FVL8_9PEZI|nr:hypothetical protein B0J12DRAFT_682530 [Macrophomina phaseolina]
MRLHDDALALVAVIGLIIPISTILVALRLYVRWRNRGFGLDDGLVLAGWALFIPSIALLIPAAYNGLGMHDGEYTLEQMKRALKYFVIWELLCLPAVICIRNSLILTLTRLTLSRPILFFLYFLITINTVATTATLIFIIVQCRPLHANWTLSLRETHCLPPTVLIRVAKSWSALSVVVDWSVALLPIPLLWHIRMRWRVKGAVMGILGLGIFASCATLVRIPLLPRLASPTEPLHNLGAITLWAFLEAGIGLVAASLTSLRPLLRRVFGADDVVVVLDGRQRAYRARRAASADPHRRWYGGTTLAGRSSGSGGAARPLHAPSLLASLRRRLAAALATGGAAAQSWHDASSGSSASARAFGGRSAKGKSGDQLVDGASTSSTARAELDDGGWDAALYYGDLSIVGMRTVVVEGAAAAASAGEDGESQRSFVGEGDIKVRRSICIETPED